MSIVDIAGTDVAPNAEATREVYTRIAEGGAEHCECLPCRNYRLVRDEAYPPNFRALLDTLGIDYRKELEVYLGVPLPDGSHLYEGWFCFAGRSYGQSIVATQQSLDGGFKYRIEDSAPSPQSEFDGLSVLHLWFATKVPWRLSECWSLEGAPRQPVTDLS